MEMKPKPNEKKTGVSYVCLYLFAFCAVGAFSPLLGQYLRSIGFSGTQIGTITASGIAVAILTSAFWGRLYQKSENKKRFIFKLAIMAAFVCASLYFVQTYLLFLFLFCALYFFQAPSIVLIDAMTIEDGRAFGAVRKWGAVGFALGVFVSGNIAEFIGPSVIFFLYAGGFVLFAAVAYGMSRRDRYQQSIPIETLPEKSKGALYQNKKYVKLLVCAFFIHGTITANNTYFGFLFIEGGGTIAGIGFAFLLMAGSEVPFMAWADKLAKTFTLEKTLFIAICLSAIRFAWYATGPPASLLLALFFLQGMATGIIIVEFVRYISKVVDAKDLGFAVSIYYALGAGLSGIVCQMAAGIILDYFNAGGVYVFFSCMNLIGAAVYVAGKLYQDRE